MNADSLAGPSESRWANRVPPGHSRRALRPSAPVRSSASCRVLRPSAFRRTLGPSAVAGPQRHPPSAAAPEAISFPLEGVSSSKNNCRMKPVGKFSLLYSPRSKCLCVSHKPDLTISVTEGGACVSYSVNPLVAVFLTIVIELAHTWEIKLVTFGLSFR